MSVFFLALTLTLQSPSLSDVRQQFEAGKFREVVDAVPAGTTDARILYVAAESRQKLGEGGEARAIWQQLAERGTDDPWRFIGRSALALADRQFDAAREAAAQAVARGGDVAEAHYQLGLAHSYRDEWPQAAAAFDRASELDSAFAYAHYYAGLTHYRAKRVDLMAARFEAFLKLAPQAPERPQVESIMRTVRGR